MKTLIEIAIIIALKEEFELVHQGLGLIATDAIGPNLGQWYECFIESSQGKMCKANVTFIGDAGPAHAIRFTTKFLEHYQPSLLVNFGLSGMLSKDVKLGDVVVVTQSDLYDDNGAIVDVNGIPCLQPSGLPLCTADFKEAADHFAFKFNVQFRRWQAACLNERNQLLSSISDLIPNTLLGSRNPATYRACGL